MSKTDDVKLREELNEAIATILEARSSEIDSIEEQNLRREVKRIRQMSGSGQSD